MESHDTNVFVFDHGYNCDHTPWKSRKTSNRSLSKCLFCEPNEKHKAKNFKVFNDEEFEQQEEKKQKEILSKKLFKQAFVVVKNL